MKVKQEEITQFAPITIILETQEEADLMWATLNIPFSRVLDKGKSGVLSDKFITIKYDMWAAFNRVY